MSSTNKGKAGSQIDLQLSIAKVQKELNTKILNLCDRWKDGRIIWYSPIEKTSFKEFWDNSFGEGRLSPKTESFWEGLKRPNDFEDFWPKGGPHWDGIAVVETSTGDKTLLLIEAKAHKSELKSDSQAKEDSLKTIKNRLKVIQRKSGLIADVDWTKRYYQFANRMAFLLFLQERMVKVAFVYILYANDPYWEKKDETTVANWENAIKKEREYFGIKEDFLRCKSIYDCIIDLNTQEFAKLKKAIIENLKCLK